MSNINKVIAYATDEPLETGLRQFSLYDSTGIVDFIENDYLKNNSDHTSIYINNELVPANKMSDRQFQSMVTAIINAIKENATIEKFTIFTRRKY